MALFQKARQRLQCHASGAKQHAATHPHVSFAEEEREEQKRHAAEQKKASKKQRRRARKGASSTQPPAASTSTGDVSTDLPAASQEQSEATQCARAVHDELDMVDAHGQRVRAKRVVGGFGIPGVQPEASMDYGALLRLQGAVQCNVSPISVPARARDPAQSC